MSDIPGPAEVQERKLFIEAWVYDRQNLIFARPDFVYSAFKVDDACKWHCVSCTSLHAGASYVFLLADNKLILAGGLCARCLFDPHLRQKLIELFSQIFPSIDWKLPMIEMPRGIQ